MKTTIQNFLKEQKIEFYMGKIPSNSPYDVYTLATINSNIKVILVVNTIEKNIVVLYWNNSLSFGIECMTFKIFEDAAPFLKVYTSTSSVHELIHAAPDTLYLNLILTHPVLQEQSFAQSLAKQLIERGKLTDNQIAYVVGPSPNNRPVMQKKVLSATNIFIAYAEKALKEKVYTYSKTAVSRTFNLKPTKGEDVIIIPTSAYTPYQYSFPNFNPVQSLVFPYINVDHNLIVGANTSAGKTICAEILMDGILAQDKKVIYLSPLKSLTQEKYSDWQKRFADKKIEIMTGDYSLSEGQVAKLKGVDIICMTSEMLDSRSRKFESEKNLWLYNVGLLIVDESHIVGMSGRGDACEVGIMRFSQINPDARILLLSATMPNVEEFGEWTTMLNNKETDIVFCDWRPVKLNMHYIEYSTDGDYYDRRNAKMQEAIDLVLEKPDEKFLVFVHDKSTGREILNLLKAKGVSALFHNADLEINDRLKIEEQYKIKHG